MLVYTIESQIFVRMSIYVFIFPHKWKLYTIGDKSFHEQNISLSKYELSVVVGLKTIKLNKTKNTLKQLGTIGDRIIAFILPENCELLHIRRDISFTFYKRNHFWFKKDLFNLTYPEQDISVRRLKTGWCPPAYPIKGFGTERARLGTFTGFFFSKSANASPKSEVHRTCKTKHF